MIKLFIIYYSMSNTSTLESTVKLSDRINAIQGNTIMKGVLHDDIDLLTQKWWYHDNSKSPYQIFWETQKQLIIDFHETWDLALLQQFIQNRTYYYAKLYLATPDNSWLEQLASSLAIKQLENEVSAKISKVLDKQAEVESSEDFLSIAYGNLWQVYEWGKWQFNSFDLSSDNSDVSSWKNDIAIIWPWVSALLVTALVTYVMFFRWKNEKTVKASTSDSDTDDFLKVRIKSRVKEKSREQSYGKSEAEQKIEKITEKVETIKTKLKKWAFVKCITQEKVEYYWIYTDVTEDWVVTIRSWKNKYEIYVLDIVSMWPREQCWQTKKQA